MRHVLLQSTHGRDIKLNMSTGEFNINTISIAAVCISDFLMLSTANTTSSGFYFEKQMHILWYLTKWEWDVLAEVTWG